MRRLFVGAVVVVLSSISLWAIDLPEILKSLKSEKPPSGIRAPQEIKRWSDLPSWVSSLAFSPDDKTLALGLKDQIQFVDVESKSLSKSIPVKSGHVRAITYSPDGSLIAAASYQNVSIFKTATMELMRELKGHRGYVTGLAFSPDGQRLATSCEDELARVWTLADQSGPTELKGHGDPVTGIAWSPDGKLIATSAGDDTRPTKPGEVRVWDATSGEMKKSFDQHQRAATGVAFSPDSHFLLSSSLDERINVYDVQENKALGFFGGHSRSTNAVVVHPDGETAISVSGGRNVGKNELFGWEIQTGDAVVTVEAHAAKITSVAVSHNGRWIATGSQDKSAVLWNVGFLSVGLPEGTSNATPPADASVAASNTAAAADAAVAQNQAAADAKPATKKELRAGIIGLDTSHAPAFAKTLNANPPVAGAEGVRIVAAYPQGSPDIPSSVERVPTYIEEMKKLGVEIVDSIDELLKKVDVILLETNDGRPHFEQLIPCLKAGKPTFIDKPVAGTLADAIAIFEAAKKYKVPVFSCSSLRFGKNTQAVRAGSIGKVMRCETSSPANLEPHHPDLFWYGIHGTESLFTVMGTGCQSVVRGKTDDGKIEVTGQWAGGRIGIYREGKGYQGKAVGEKEETAVGAYDGYDPLVFEIVKFFHTGQAPVSSEETLEIYAFMEAADESKRQNGASVTLESVMTKARQQAAKKIAELK